MSVRPVCATRRSSNLAARLVFVANAPIDETRSATFPLPTSQITSTLEPVVLRSVCASARTRVAMCADGRSGWVGAPRRAGSGGPRPRSPGPVPIRWQVMAADPASIDNFFSFTTVRPPNGETVSELIAQGRPGVRPGVARRPDAAGHLADGGQGGRRPPPGATQLGVLQSGRGAVVRLVLQCFRWQMETPRPDAVRSLVNAVESRRHTLILVRTYLTLPSTIR